MMGSKLYLLSPMVSLTVCLMVCLSLFLPFVTAQATRNINVAGMFEPSETQIQNTDSQWIFQKALDFVKWDEILQESNTELNGYSYNISAYDGFQLSLDICEALRNLQISAALGLTSKPLRDYMHVLSQKTELPYLELMPSDDYSQDSVIHLHPSPLELVEVVRKLIIEWKWPELFFVYEDSYALDRYLGLLSMDINERIQVHTHQLNPQTGFTESLEYLRKLEVKNIIVDCSVQQIPRFLNRALELQLLTKGFHYHFTSLDLHVLDLAHYSFGGATITWSQLIQRPNERLGQRIHTGIRTFESFLQQHGTYIIPKRFYTTHIALIWDGLLLVSQALRDRLNGGANFTTANIDCETETRWSDGFGLRNFIKQQDSDNFLSGRIKFHNTGRRIGYTLYLMELQPQGVINEIGQFTQEEGVKLNEVSTTTPSIDVDNWRTKILKITTLERPPFLANKSMNGKALVGNDRYEGFIVDLMQQIATHLPIRYEFVYVKDSQYGSRGEYREGDGDDSFNGMVGEVYRREADMAAAPLTINYDREQAVDFTKPFMTFGISILFKKPQKKQPNLLSFSEPITNDVWLSIAASLLVVSLCMYVLGRFSPTEWENPFPCQEDHKFTENQFKLSNVFWFSIGSFMQQGCDIMPRGPSTRIIAVAWWAFTLIIISSYTANLAAFLTITTLSETFKNAGELYNNDQDIRYGCRKEGTTCGFFENSDIQLYKDMWRTMNTTKDVLVKETEEGIKKVREGNYAFFMESSMMQYTIVTDEKCELQQVGPVLNSLSYGIAVRQNSALRDELSHVILQLNENQVLLELYNKWWKVDDNRCALKGSDSNADLKLELQMLEGVFVFLLGGLALAVIILLIEICLFTIHKSKKDKRSCCSVLCEWLVSSVKGKFPNSVSVENLTASQVPSGRASRASINNNKGSHDKTEEELEPLNNGHIPMAGSKTTDTFI